MHEDPSDTLAHRPAHGDRTEREFIHHSSAQRVFTDAVIADSLKEQYPGVPLTIIPRSGCDLLAYAASGHATAVPKGSEAASWDGSLKYRIYFPPARRMDGGTGVIVTSIIFEKFEYTWEGHDWIVYVVSGRDAMYGTQPTESQFVLGDAGPVDGLMRAAGNWANDLHEEIWIFDGGYWQKSKELYESVEEASWKDVILDEDKKKTIQTDVLRFFESQERYKKLRVPWKRGIIYYGPPGNGKTISIKAMMHTLYHLKEPIPTLYVRTLTSFAGPEYSIRQIFRKARQTAPCFLVFEDLDSIVTDQVRSYFLNEVDGLQTNDGVLMLGSTNHLDRLDPGISKRPSRFDRKYEFTKPNLEQRIQYCDYWRGKLSDNEEIDFPEGLSKKIAEITDDFSFAFMQEAFIATLLAIAGRGNEAKVEESGWEDVVLWVEIQKQVKILREEM